MSNKLRISEDVLEKSADVGTECKDLYERAKRRHIRACAKYDEKCEYIVGMSKVFSCWMYKKNIEAAEIVDKEFDSLLDSISGYYWDTIGKELKSTYEGLLIRIKACSNSIKDNLELVTTLDVGNYGKEDYPEIKLLDDNFEQAIKFLRLDIAKKNNLSIADSFANRYSPLTVDSLISNHTPQYKKAIKLNVRNKAYRETIDLKLRMAELIITKIGEVKKNKEELEAREIELRESYKEDMENALADLTAKEEILFNYGRKRKLAKELKAVEVAEKKKRVGLDARLNQFMASCKEEMENALADLNAKEEMIMDYSIKLSEELKATEVAEKKKRVGLEIRENNPTRLEEGEEEHVAVELAKIINKNQTTIIFMSSYILHVSSLLSFNPHEQQSQTGD